MLQGCLNGNRTKDFSAGVPFSPAELARDALAVVSAGAQELHFHPRDEDGQESLEPSHVAAALGAVRKAVPGVRLGLSTHWSIPPGGRERQKLMRSWTTVPDYVSVNLIEEDAPELIAWFLRQGIGVEAGLWSAADARRFVALPDATSCLRVLIEINEQEAEEAMRVADAIVDVLDAEGVGLPRLLHGLESTKWLLFRRAIASGYSTRIGFEDGKALPNGQDATANAALIEAALEIVRV